MREMGEMGKMGKMGRIITPQSTVNRPHTPYPISND
jgi:hypothetical protein